MKEKNENRGQSVVEILISLAVFCIILLGVLFLFFKSLDNSRQAVEVSQAQNLAQEGIEGVRTIANNNWKDLVDGSYEIENSAGYWQFITPRSQTLLNKYSRQIDITPSTRRPDDCLLQEGEEYGDRDIKKVVSTVFWIFNGIEKNVSYTTYLSNWINPNASCGEALCLNVNVSLANVDETKKSMTGVKIINNCHRDITIDKMTLTWTVPGKITDIKIENNDYWTKNGPGTPLGSQPSGTEIDIQDFILYAGGTYEVTRFRFDSKIDGSIVTIKSKMRDGSTLFEVSTLPFAP